MLKNNQNSGGFTLIEVLVAVLIIGILTSIALPHYQKSVVKARFAQAKIMANTLAEAEEVYYATHMKYTPVLDNLDVSVDVTKYPTDCTSESSSCQYRTPWGMVQLNTDGRVFCKTDDLAYAAFLQVGHWSNRPRLCFAYKNNHAAKSTDFTYKFCQQETGSTTPESTWTNLTGFVYVK